MGEGQHFLGQTAGKAEKRKRGGKKTKEEFLYG
jgi:hypothetical protein